jgi:hypothetical protein
MAAKIRANRRKLRDELIIHRQKLHFFNKKIVLPTPICKFNQLIRIDDKKSKPTAFRLAFFILMLTDFVAFFIGYCSFSYSMTIFHYQMDICSPLDKLLLWFHVTKIIMIPEKRP